MKPVLQGVKDLEARVAAHLCAARASTRQADAGLPAVSAESLMIEHAALALKKEIFKYIKSHDVDPADCAVAVACGSGNNASDGLTLARMLFKDVKVVVLQVSQPKSQYAVQAFKVVEELSKLEQIQDKELILKNTCGMSASEIQSFIKTSCGKNPVIVDCIYGTGFHGKMSDEISEVIQALNNVKGFKLACDIPSGLDKNGQSLYGLLPQEYRKNVFIADRTLTMFALKQALFTDSAKDAAGKIKVAKLCIGKNLLSQYVDSFNKENPVYLCSKKDVKLPLRKFNNVHKGTFGHTCVILGEKPGAALIASQAAFKSGSGLVSLLPLNPSSEFSLPQEIMKAQNIPANCTAISIGSGLGRECDVSSIFDYILENQKPCVLDADIFYNSGFVPFLEKAAEKNIPLVLTPHPKELAGLCTLFGLSEDQKEISACDAALNRMDIGRKFTQKFPNAVLVMKGANTFIAFQGEIYIVTKGAPSLAKGGSGDVLAGVIAGLMAQKYCAKDAAITGVLMHAMAGRKAKDSYSLTPYEVIKNL
ncbi:MAG: NAD(P)H-hydrate dehydratase [Treponema sp.]|nr:NAD(P)H-hydrate dehydratase [Treponema sp.]